FGGCGARAARGAERRGRVPAHTGLARRAHAHGAQAALRVRRERDARQEALGPDRPGHRRGRAPAHAGRRGLGAARVSRKKDARRVDGILVVDKPAGMSSNAVLQRAKGIFFARKAGHTGSLDPLATGVLPLCFGEATKLSQYLLGADKEYVTTLALGVRTD